MHIRSRLQGPGALLLSLLLLACPALAEEPEAKEPWVEVKARPGVDLTGSKHLLIPIPTIHGYAVLHVPGRSEIPLPGDNWKSGAQHQAKVNPEKTLAAVRSGTKGDWRIVYLGKNDRAFVSKAWVKGAPDWRLAPPFSKVARELYLAAEDEEGRRRVMFEVRDREGPGAVANVLLETAEYVTRTENTAWDGAFEQLPPEQQAAVRTGLAPVLTAANAPPRHVIRAILYADIHPGDFKHALQARLLEWRQTDTNEQSWATGVAFRKLMELAPDEAASTGCQALGYGLQKFDYYNPAQNPERLAAAALAVARQKVRCPALDKLLGEKQCDEAIRCDPRKEERKNQPLGGLFSAADPTRDPVCEQDELEAEIKAVLGSPMVQGAKGLSAARVAFLRAYRQNMVPHDLEKKNERRRYVLDDAKEERCDSKHPERKRCKCREPDVRRAACEAPLDQREVTFEACAVQIDDEAEQLRSRVIEKR